MKPQSSWTCPNCSAVNPMDRGSCRACHFDPIGVDQPLRPKKKPVEPWVILSGVFVLVVVVLTYLPVYILKAQGRPVEPATVQSSQPWLETCPMCNGSGRRPDVSTGYTENCRTCGGKGTMMVTPSK